MYVPSTHRGAVLFANVFIAACIEFDLLLGHPWQQDNKVSISERQDGTYLIFDHPWLVSGPMELFVGTAMAPLLWDGPYIPITAPASVPGFRMTMPGRSDQPKVPDLPYIQA